MRPLVPLQSSSTLHQPRDRREGDRGRSSRGKVARGGSGGSGDVDLECGFKTSGRDGVANRRAPGQRWDKGPWSCQGERGEQLQCSRFRPSKHHKPLRGPKYSRSGTSGRDGVENRRAPGQRWDKGPWSCQGERGEQLHCSRFRPSKHHKPLRGPIIFGKGEGQALGDPSHDHSA
jgi:hypothetical protein